MMPARRLASAVVGACVAPAALTVGIHHLVVPSAQSPTASHQAATASAPTSTLLQMIEVVPPVASGAASYATRDSQGNTVDALDPIDAPGGGYLGVYHTLVAGGTFKITLGRSSDLIHWSPVTVLEPSQASMPTLQEVGATGGYLLAYERDTPPTNQIVIRYYAGLDALLANSWSAEKRLTAHLSSVEGTPSFRGVQWNGSLSASVLTLGFHYNQLGSNGTPSGLDREGLGTLTGFSTWTETRDDQMNTMLTNAGYPGKHGDRRQFAYQGYSWRIYEAQNQNANLNDFTSWRPVLDDIGAGQLDAVVMQTAAGSTSFGNPVVRILHAPDGQGEVMAVTMFVFGEGAAGGEAGDLVFYKRLSGSGSASSPTPAPPPSTGTPAPPAQPPASRPTPKPSAPAPPSKPAPQPAPPVTPSAPPPGLGSGPASTSVPGSPGVLFVAVRGADGHAWLEGYANGAWSGWYDMGEQIIDAPSIVSWGAGRLDIFARGIDHHLLQRTLSNGTWGAWQVIGGDLTSGPSATIAPGTTGWIGVAARGADGAVWYTYFYNGAWGPWLSLGEQILNAPSIASWGSGRLDVFAEGTDHHLYRRIFSGGVWSSWTMEGGYLTSAPSASVTLGTTGYVGVAARGSDNAVWVTVCTATACGAWGSMGGTLESHPAMTSWGTGHADVFIEGTDQRLWQDIGTDTTWSGWHHVGG